MKKLLLSISLLAVSFSDSLGQGYPGWILPSTNVDSLRRVMIANRKPLPPIIKHSKYDSFVMPVFNTDSIQYEFVKLYLQHCKEIGKTSSYSKEIDTAVNYHLNYIKEHVDFTKPIEGSNDFHYEEPLDMRTPNLRMGNLNPSVSYLKYGNTAEVAAAIIIVKGREVTFTDTYRTNKDIAKGLYDLLMRSKPHKNIMEDKTYTHFNYGVIIFNDKFVIVGDFYQELKYK